jgi:hypothetical protein
MKIEARKVVKTSLVWQCAIAQGGVQAGFVDCLFGKRTVRNARVFR